MRQPGIEPGSIAWKATMLTFMIRSGPTSLAVRRPSLPSLVMTGRYPLVSSRVDMKILISNSSSTIRTVFFFM